MLTPAAYRAAAARAAYRSACAAARAESALRRAGYWAESAAAESVRAARAAVITRARAV